MRHSIFFQGGIGIITIMSWLCPDVSAQTHNLQTWSHYDEPLSSQCYRQNVGEESCQIRFLRPSNTEQHASVQYRIEWQDQSWEVFRLYQDEYQVWLPDQGEWKGALDKSSCWFHLCKHTDVVTSYDLLEERVSQLESRCWHPE